MKTRLILCFVLLSTPYLFSQDEIGIPKLKPVNDYWSIGYYGSGNMSIANGYDKEPIQPGFGGTLEFAHNDNKKELLFAVSYNRLNSSLENTHFETYDFTLGPRFIFKNEKFVEVTAGMLLINTVTRFYSEFDDEYYFDNNINDPNVNFCVSAAAGAKININNNTDFLFKLRLTSSFQNELFSYLTVNVGIAFNNKKPKIKIKKSNPNSYFAVALFGGGNDPDPLSRQWYYKWGINTGLELSYKSSPKIELILDGNYNIMKFSNRRGENLKEYMTTVTAGGRLLINKSATAAFLEAGFGLYSFKRVHIYSAEYNGDVRDYPGFNIGTGTKISLINFLDFIAKANLNFLFSEKYDDVPNYIILQGGLRFNL